METDSPSWMGYFMPFNGSINPDGRGALAAAIVVVDETREDTERRSKGERSGFHMEKTIHRSKSSQTVVSDRDRFVE